MSELPGGGRGEEQAIDRNVIFIFNDATKVRGGGDTYCEDAMGNSGTSASNVKVGRIAPPPPASADELNDCLQTRRKLDYMVWGWMEV